MSAHFFVLIFFSIKAFSGSSSLNVLICFSSVSIEKAVNSVLVLFHHSRSLNGSDHGIEMFVGMCVCVRVYKTFF